MESEFSKQSVGTVVNGCDPAPKETHWIEIELVGEDDKPIPYARYAILLPDGTAIGGYLDREGFARIDNLPVSGQCQVSWPEYDAEAWEFVQTMGARAE